MIVLFNPLSTTPGKQPLPLSLMSLAAVLEGHGARGRWSTATWCADPAAEIIARLAVVPALLTPMLAVTVMPGPQLTQAVVGLRARQGGAAARADRLGRLFSDPARRHRAARAVRRLRDPLAGRARDSAADQGPAFGRHPQQRQRPLVENRAGGADGAGRAGGDRQQPGAAADQSRRSARAAVPPSADGALHPPQLSRRANHGAQLVVRLSVRVQLLRGGGDVEPALAGAVAGADGARDAPSGLDLSRRCRADARHGFLHQRAAHRGILRAHRRSRPALVGARPRRHA